MKVLVVAKTLSKGGAASGARNLINSLKIAGANVVTMDASVMLARSPLHAARVAERILERLLTDAETHFLRFGPPTFDLKALYSQYKPDVIQLCDISANTIRFRDVANIPCPVVHRMSDFWPYHGAHHYAVYPPRKPDIADWVMKRLVFDGRCIPHHRVAPSDWLAKCLGGQDISVIRNAVVTPLDVSRRSLINGHLRFGFISGQIMDPRKGFVALPRLLSAIAASTSYKVHLHIFGSNASRSLPAIPGVETINHPSFSYSELATVYSSFDILLCPSHLDNSPNVVTEALAHGTPVIGQVGTGMDSYIFPAFGGLIDYHCSNFYAVDAFMSAVLNIVRNWSECSIRAQSFVREELSQLRIGMEYLALYKRLLSGF